MRGLRAVFSLVLPAYCAALTLHIEARSNQAEARRAQPAESAFCTSFMLIFHTAIIKKKILYRSNLEKQLQQAHYITFFPFGLWQLSACLNRCHQHLSTWYCAVFFLLIPPFFCLKEQTSFYNLNVHLMAKDG